MFQSTHPCGVRTLVFDFDSVQKVSIHAPVWGANKMTIFICQCAEYMTKTKKELEFEVLQTTKTNSHGTSYKT